MADQQATHRVVLTTAGSDEQAETIARALVDSGLAACVNIVHGNCSIYRWKGETVRESEEILIIKTTAERFEAVRGKIRELHSYDVPEIVSLPVLEGDADYLRWIDEAVKAP
jgi:periplasmic divalent cation tolerance protein